MKRKNTILILSVSLFCSFFFPVFDWHHSDISGFNYVLSDHFSIYKYLLLPVPFSAIIFFFSAYTNEFYFLRNKNFSWVPLLSLLLFFVNRYRNWNAENSFSI